MKQSDEGIFICQSKYTKELIRKFVVQQAKPMKILMNTNWKVDPGTEGKLVDYTRYKEIIGSVLYLTRAYPIYHMQ